jgi:hypothetical protein
MRSVEEYLNRAQEFDELAARTDDSALKTRYADLAACYRLLASERRRLIADSTLSPDEAV